MTASFDWLAGRRVFLTGHTGFKGSWLTLTLSRLGALVTGYALPPTTCPSLFTLAGVQAACETSHFDDILNASRLVEAVRAARPELIIHMAAQPLVRRSYREPHLTWNTNVIGTVNLLEAVRQCPTARGILVVTTDKCYENHEWCWGYRESDPLGGADPYSASKAAAELVVQSYRKSFFEGSASLLASARAGNVIGGGDWSEDRLIPDAARSAAAGVPLIIRNPDATRPWQHVLESLRGYLLLSEKLLQGDRNVADAFNFGPSAVDNLPVAEVLQQLQRHWRALEWHFDPEIARKSPHEARCLYLDSSKARSQLNWTSVWPLNVGIEKTAVWYQRVLRDSDAARAITDQQLEEFFSQ
ncbi:MAG: CDP-glucose 4,6-dehydratase [Pseudomonadota bacterium]|jgi:CDP-glucose 4,6-dehydratase|nr:CDP-glucose 4,6-dehydratase [Pseudomonadota bacterium]